MAYVNLVRQTKHQKAGHQVYLNNTNEPLDNVLGDSPNAHKTMLTEDCSDMRRQLRALALELRNSFLC